MNDIKIDLKIDKPPYIKKLTADNIINLTGESGSGKSTYAKENFNSDEYILLDTDKIFKNDIHSEFNKLLKNKYGDNYLDYYIERFDEYYVEMINFYKEDNKILVIDSAQFRNIKDITILKGTIIVIRTGIEICYQRCIERFKKNNPNATLDEIEKYALKKKNIFNWYHSLNDFIVKIDKL